MIEKTVLSLLKRKVPQAHIPTGIRFEGNDADIALSIGAAATKNMQSDAAAVDAWALVLLSLDRERHVRIELDQTPADLTANEMAHARRLGYRMDRFAALFPGRVRLGPNMTDLVNRTSGEVDGGLLNIAGSGRAQDGEPAPGASEKAIELQLCSAHGPVRLLFMDRNGLEKLCLQFPVGLFRERVSKATRLFPGGGARIDLIGVDTHRAIHVFELKNRTNRKVGALSELMFYSWVLADAREPNARFHFKSGAIDPAADVKPEDVRTSSAIVAHLLMHGNLGTPTGPHALIDQTVFDLLNGATADRGWPIRYEVASWDGLGVIEEALPA